MIMWRRVLAVASALLAMGGGSAMAFELKSPSFPPGGGIPVEHTCDGRDVSPALRWTSPPPKTKSFALIADDPDAPGGTWVHWVLYAIPAAAGEVAEGVPPRDSVAGVGVQGANDFGKVGYRGPCPPRGPAHRYFFKLYALDTELSLPAKKSKAELLKALEGHVLGQAELMGRYKRK
jgi:Raf kinase inhibitor-like YbhB/YbcL family protein